MQHERETGDIIEMFETRLKTRPKTTYIMTITDTHFASVKGSKIDERWGIMAELAQEAADAFGITGEFTHKVCTMAGEVVATNGHPNVLLVTGGTGYYSCEKAFRGLANYIFMQKDSILDEYFRMPMITVFVGGLDDDLRRAMFDALYPIDWIRIVEVFEKEEQS